MLCPATQISLWIEGPIIHLQEVQVHIKPSAFCSFQELPSTEESLTQSFTFSRGQPRSDDGLKQDNKGPVPLPQPGQTCKTILATELPRNCLSPLSSLCPHYSSTSLAPVLPFFLPQVLNPWALSKKPSVDISPSGGLHSLPWETDC